MVNSNEWKETIVKESDWSSVTKSDLDASFRKWCIWNMSESQYNNGDISLVGKMTKKYTINELKKKRIMIDISDNRGRGTVGGFSIDDTDDIVT